MRARASLFTTLLTSALVAAAFAASCSNGGGQPATGPGTAGSGSGNAGSGPGTGGSTSAGTGGSTAAGTAGADGAGTAGATGSAGSSAAGVTGTAGAGSAGATGTAGAGSVGTAGTGGPFAIPTVAWPSAACKTMATTLVGQMTRAEKAAQMVMAPLGSASTADVKALAPGAVFAPGGYPDPAPALNTAGWGALLDSYIALVPQTAHQIPFLIGADAVHGNNTAAGAVIFPHNAGLGGSNDPALVQKAAQITAMEGAAAGLNWTFAPFAGVSWDSRWGRVYESFSEDATIANTFVAAATMGLQGAAGLGSGGPFLVGCSKHWAGDGQAVGPSNKGAVVDRGNITVDEATMMKVGVGPYMGALGAGLGSVMVSDASWNGVSLTVNNHMVTEVLKGTLKFPGFVSTDWNAATESKGASINAAINAGVDMLMQPADWKGAITTITNATAIPEARITDAATRIIETKCQAGLFGWKRDTTLAASVGSADHRMVARQAVRESMVLLQNTGNVLPIAKTAKVFVTGSGSDSIANQCGGWTITWQGNGSKTTGTTIKAAIAKVVTPAASMADAEVVVVVLSEKPYAEFQGDSTTLNTLSTADFALVTQAKMAGKKVVAVVTSGRPVLIADHLADAGAWIAAWLPGTEGDGVADVLFGDYKPTAKLSHTWPRTDAQSSLIYSAATYDPLFKLGFGLSY